MNKLVIFSIFLIFITFSISCNKAFTPIECDLCQLSVDSIALVAKTDNLTEPEIFSALQRICNSIPSNYSGLCNTLLKYSGEQIIDQVLNGTRSEVVCTELSICTTSNIKSNDLCHYQRVNKLIPSSNKLGQDCNEKSVGACYHISKYIDHVNRIVTNQKQNNFVC